MFNRTARTTNHHRQNPDQIHQVHHRPPTGPIHNSRHRRRYHHFQLLCSGSRNTNIDRCTLNQFSCRNNAWSNIQFCTCTQHTQSKIAEQEGVSSKLFPARCCQVSSHCQQVMEDRLLDLNTDTTTLLESLLYRYVG